MRKRITFFVLYAYGYQSYARVFNTANRFHIIVCHECELHEPLRRTVHICAAIDKTNFAAGFGGQKRAKRGSAHAANSADDKYRSGQHRAGTSRGNHAGSERILFRYFQSFNERRI